MLGTHLIKSWSSSQPSVSLSSAEAEFYGLVKAAGMGLGYQALLRDLSYDLPVTAYTDLSAAMGICNRQGLGKLRHLDTHSLWIQQAVRTGRVTVRKVKGEHNPADLFTKHIPVHDKVLQLVALFGCRYLPGRAARAPELRRERQTKEVLADVVSNTAYKIETDEGLTMDEVQLWKSLEQIPDPQPGVLPHLHPECDRQRLFPRMKVPVVDALEDFDLQRRDDVERMGAKISQNIIQETLVHGRRRRQAADTHSIGMCIADTYIDFEF